MWVIGLAADLLFEGKRTSIGKTHSALRGRAAVNGGSDTARTERGENNSSINEA
jgi:hypothetical protein